MSLILKDSHVYLLTIAILIGIIFFMRECGGGGVTDCPPIIKSDTITVIKTTPPDSIFRTVYRARPVPIYRDTGSLQIRFKNIDTAAILKDYFATYYYIDSIKEDSNFSLVILDTIRMNAIWGRSVRFKNLLPQLDISTTITNERRQRATIRAYGAPIVGINSEGRINLGAGLLVINKKEHGYSFQYDAIQKDYRIGLWFKIRLKPRKPFKIPTFIPI